MAFDGSQSAAAYNHLIRATPRTSGTTYRWAQGRGVALDDGTLWESLLDHVPPLTLSAGAIKSVRIVNPDMTIRLRDIDGALQTIAEATSSFADYDFEYLVGHGKGAADYEVRFTGRAQFPGGIAYDDQSLTIRLINTVDGDARPLPTSKIFPSAYANAEAKSKYKPIPIVIGDWRTTAGGGETLPAYCLNTTTKLFTWSEGPVVGLEDVYKNGASVAFTADDANGQFTLGGAVTYDPDTDIITVNGQGVTQDGTASGTLAQTLPDIMDYLLQQQLGVAAGKVDSAALAVWDTQLSATDVGRRWIGTETSSKTLLSELGNEGFADIIQDNDGVYTAKFRIAGNPAASTIYREGDIAPKPGSAGGRLFSVQQDPEQLYCNECIVESRNSPSIDVAGIVTTSYKVTDENEDTAAITAVGQRVRFRIKANYLYVDGAGSDRSNRQLLAFSTEPQFPRVTLRGAAMMLKPTDQFQLMYRQYVIIDPTLAVPMMVREATPNFQNMTIDLVVWNLDNLTPKRYHANGAADYATETDTYTKEVFGYYEQDATQVYF